MSKRSSILTAALAAALVALPTASSASASAQPAAVKAQHCVNHVVGEEADGRLILSDATCYATFAGAMRAEGVVAHGDGAAERAAASGVARAQFTLAVHYDLANLNPAGGTISTVGTVCGGGYTNMPSAWNNRISSTANGCPYVIHYDLINKGGASFTTTGAGGNLGPLSNLVGSVQYS